MPPESIRVFLIEPNSQDILMFQMMLADVKDFHFVLTSAPTLNDALPKLNAGGFQLVLLDLSVKDGKGLEIMSFLQSHGPNLPLVIVSNREDQALAYEAVKRGAQDYLIKGKLDPSLLSRVIHHAIERHRVMEEMRRKNEELQHLNSLKTEFVSTVSHELRTPLTVILSASNNLLDGAFGDLTEDQKKWMKKINHHSIRLHDMISDILNLSKLQSGKSEMNRAQIDLGKLLRTTLVNLQVLTKEKKITLTHKLADNMPMVWADAGRLEQVITNLVANAIKFTPVEGKIEVTALEKAGHLEVTVEDNGPGIAEEHREMIFDRFRQVRSTSDGANSTQGIGLGLAISKEIVEQHQGKIWVESQLGRGSSFKFRVPVDFRVARKPAVLVVDDDDQICELMEVTLNRAGYHVVTSKNGKHAIQCLLEKNARFDLVFLDLVLPGANGVEIVKTIREHKIQCDIVLLTAYPNSDMFFQAMSTGPLTVVAKPFDPSTVADVAAKLLAARAPGLARKLAA